MPRTPGSPWLATMAALALIACSGGGEAESTDAAAANPCAANPCAAAQATIDPAKVMQGDRELSSGGNSPAQLIAMGRDLWNDKSLSGPGTTACATCHVNYQLMNATFAEPYPHTVQMAKDRAGLEQVTAAEMVQLCMVIPMMNEPLDWGSVELAALSAYVEDIQKDFTPPAAGAANPCAANPCAANPCAANPCGANPCGANPCAGR